jgi:DnaJ-class molecular chaperone
MIENPELMEKITFYKILQINEDASMKKIKEVCKHLLTNYHTDKNTHVNAKNFISKIDSICEILKDIEKREIYHCYRGFCLELQMNITESENLVKEIKEVLKKKGIKLTNFTNGKCIANGGIF